MGLSPGVCRKIIWGDFRTSGTPLILTSRYLFRKKKEQKNENLGDGPEKNLEATGSGAKNKKDKKIMLEMLDTERKF